MIELTAVAGVFCSTSTSPLILFSSLFASSSGPCATGPGRHRHRPQPPPHQPPRHKSGPRSSLNRASSPRASRAPNSSCAKRAMSRPKDGFYPELGHMITGGGWISAGPGFRHHLLNDRALIDMSAAVSWRAYKIAQARFELPYLADERLAIGAQALWQDFTQVQVLRRRSRFPVGRAQRLSDEIDQRRRLRELVGHANARCDGIRRMAARADAAAVCGCVRFAAIPIRCSCTHTKARRASTASRRSCTAKRR